MAENGIGVPIRSSATQTGVNSLSQKQKNYKYTRTNSRRACKYFVNCLSESRIIADDTDDTDDTDFGEACCQVNATPSIPEIWNEIQRFFCGFLRYNGYTVGFHCVLGDRQRLSCLRHVWIVHIELFSFVQPNLQTRNCLHE